MRCLTRSARSLATPATKFRPEVWRLPLRISGPKSGDSGYEVQVTMNGLPARCSYLVMRRRQAELSKFVEKFLPVAHICSSIRLLSSAGARSRDIRPLRSFCRPPLQRGTIGTT